MSNTIIDEIKKSFKNSNNLLRLIYINGAVFVAALIFRLILFFFKMEGTQFILQWFAVPADLSSLLFKPWTLFTYMFLHVDFFHIFFNMIVLYFGGMLFEQYLGGKKLVNVYILGGLAGAVLYILAFNIFPVFNEIAPISKALGASASVMAILVGIATYIPNFSVRLMFIGNVKLKYIAIFFIVMDLLRIPSGNAGGHIAHLGGAVFGFLFIRQLQKGKDISKGFGKLLDSLMKAFQPKKKSRMNVAYKKKKKYHSDYEYKADKVEEQKQIDAILDKISKSGYDSLTKKEKEILFRASNDK